MMAAKPPPKDKTTTTTTTTDGLQMTTVGDVTSGGLSQYGDVGNTTTTDVSAKSTPVAQPEVKWTKAEKSAPPEKPKVKPKLELKLQNGTIVVQDLHLRYPENHGEYLMKDAEGKKYILRREPVKKLKIQLTNEILRETAKLFQGKKKEKTTVVGSIMLSAVPKLGSNVLLLTPFSLQIYEILKILKQFSEGCALNVSLQCLQAIQYLHQAGYILRNVKPSAFSIGFDEQETKVMLTDFRRARAHFEPGSKPKKVRVPRKIVPYGGTSRYASIAGLKEQEQGRKDDLESWIYMVYEFLDPENGLSWKKVPRGAEMIKEKERFKKHHLPNTYKKVPEEFKKLVDMVHELKYDSAPDYDAIKEIVENVGKSKDLDMTKCDWVGKFTTEGALVNAIQQSIEKSTGNVFTGEDDFEHANRTIIKMNPDDIMKSEKATWTVVSMLGFGGFGAVYKVYDVKDKNKFYALKTENADGAKDKLRLKVELQVLQTIQEARKNAKKPAYKHFVELVDRGRSDSLKCKFVVMTLVGPSLDDIRRKYNIPLHEKQTPFIIAIQTLNSIADLHNLGYLHRDIKPANYAVGLGSTESTIIMLDFGIGRCHLDPKTKNPKPPRSHVHFFGTMRYASIAGMKNQDQGRKDDVEVWFYMIHEILNPVDGLPWKELKQIVREKWHQAIISRKIEFLSEVGNDSDAKFGVIANYLTRLTYSSAINYEFLRECIRLVARNKGYTEKDLNGDGAWVGKLNEKNLKVVPERKVEQFSDPKSDGLSRCSEEMYK